MNHEENNRRTYEAFVSAWAAADLERLMTYVTDDIVYGASVGPDPGATSSGKPDVREGFRIMALQEIEWVILGRFQSAGSMQVRILSRRYSSSRSPYARRWMTRILLLRPSTNPSETLFSGLQ